MQLKFGEIYKRKELHDHFGGNRQSGISAPAKFPVIFLINSSGGDENGYEDGWMEDGWMDGWVEDGWMDGI